MAKQPPRDHDATMDLSLSQLVVDPPPTPASPSPPKLPGMPPAKPPPQVANAPKSPKGGANDVSMWAYKVVGTDDFAPTPKESASPVRPFFLVLLVLAILGGGAYVAYTIVH